MQKDTFKEEGKFEERVAFYKGLKISNEELEGILKDHWEVKELQVSLDHNGGKKGKGAASDQKMNMDPFGFESGDEIGLLTSSFKRGLKASVDPDNGGNGVAEDDTGIPQDNDDDILTEEKQGKAILGAFS